MIDRSSVQPNTDVRRGIYAERVQEQRLYPFVTSCTSVCPQVLQAQYIALYLQLKVTENNLGWHRVQLNILHRPLLNQLQIIVCG